MHSGVITSYFSTITVGRIIVFCNIIKMIMGNTVVLQSQLSVFLDTFLSVVNDNFNRFRSKYKYLFRVGLGCKVKANHLLVRPGLWAIFVKKISF